MHSPAKYGKMVPMEKWKAYFDKLIEYGTTFRRWVCKLAFRNPDYSQDMTWREVGNYVSLLLGAIVNLSASFFKIICGFVFDSAWITSIGIYYLLLSGIRFMLLLGEWRRSRQESESEHMLHGYKSCRLCGVFTLFVSFLLAGMGIPMIYENPFHDYPKWIMTAFVLFAVYYFIVAIVNMVHFINMNNPILTAAKRVSMATALVSAYSVETAWVAKYGMPTNFYLSRIMNMVTGSMVGFLVFVLAVSMIVQGSHAAIHMRRGMRSQEK